MLQPQQAAAAARQKFCQGIPITTLTGAEAMRFLPIHHSALLVELETLEQAAALHEALLDKAVPGIVEMIPAAQTVLVCFNPLQTTAEKMAGTIRRINLAGPVRKASQQVEIPVHYNGEDLGEVAGFLGLGVEELIRLHTESDYYVAFTGFAPGFAYLSGGHPLFDVPRRKTPRTHIPAGSVALAGTFSGVYPQASPGGWQLIGTTGERMFDPERNPPALLQPGFRVRFRNVDAGKITMPVKKGKRVGKPAATVPDKQAVFEVCAQALPVFYQDAGRPHMADQGVGASGALDRAAFRAANLLVGNTAECTTLEITLGGLELKALADTVIAVSGAECPVTIKSKKGDEFACHIHQPIAIEAGDVVKTGLAERGMRAYLAVRGGFAAERVLGSSATDILAKLGPAPVQRGDVLYRCNVCVRTAVQLSFTPGHILPAADETVVLDVMMGPRTDWFTPEALALFTTQLWSVSDQSNRIGNRLTGTHPLTRARPGELPSEGATTGAIQVPPSGQPVLFLADHPLTGGYPVIACVADYHIDLAAQIPVGAKIRFNPVTDFFRDIAMLNRHGEETKI